MAEAVITNLEFPDTVSLFFNERDTGTLNVLLPVVNWGFTAEMRKWDNVSNSDPTAPSQGSLILMQGNETASIDDADISYQSWLDWAINDPTPIGDTYRHGGSTYDTDGNGVIVGQIDMGEIQGIAEGDAKVGLLDQDTREVVITTDTTLTSGRFKPEDIHISNIEASTVGENQAEVQYSVLSKLNWGQQVNLNVEAKDSSGNTLHQERETLMASGSINYGQENISDYSKTMYFNVDSRQPVEICMNITV